MSTLNAAQARARLERMLQWQAAPALTSAEVDDLMTLVPQMADASGVRPGEAGYTPTYSAYTAAYREAAATGWEWKAGKVAGQFDAATGTGTKFDRSQAHAMCLAMAASYGGGGGRGATLGSVRIATANSAGGGE